MPAAGGCPPVVKLLYYCFRFFDEEGFSPGRIFRRGRRCSRYALRKEKDMKKQTLSVRGKRWSRWPVAVLVAVTAVPLTVLGADRLVLCEEFTSTT